MPYLVYLEKQVFGLKSLGLKDASAITEQFVGSPHKGKPIEDFSTEKYSLTKIGFTKKPLSKKEMIGNNFKIHISDCSDNSIFFY